MVARIGFATATITCRASLPPTRCWRCLISPAEVRSAMERADDRGGTTVSWCPKFTRADRAHVQQGGMTLFTATPRWNYTLIRLQCLQGQKGARHKKLRERNDLNAQRARRYAVQPYERRGPPTMVKRAGLWSAAVSSARGAPFAWQKGAGSSGCRNGRQDR